MSSFKDAIKVTKNCIPHFNFEKLEKEDPELFKKVTNDNFWENFNRPLQNLVDISSSQK